MNYPNYDALPETPVEHANAEADRDPEAVHVQLDALDRLAQSATLNRLAKRCYEASEANGWYDSSRSFGDTIALIHTEASEAFEEYRNGQTITRTYYNPEKPTKPEGVPSELADIVIRVLDFCGSQGIDIGAMVEAKLAYNATRGHRHGGKAL